MPLAPLRPCNRCRRPSRGQCGHCGPVTRQRQRAEPRLRLYESKEWKALRLEVLAAAGYRCQCPEHAGRFLLPRASVVHHRRDHFGNAELFWQRENLVAYASACHHRHHGQQQRERATRAL